MTAELAESAATDVVERREAADALAKQVMARWAGHDLDRVMAGLDIWSYRSPAQTHHRQQAAGFHVPGLPDDPWIDPDAFGCADVLRDAYEGIRDEAARFMDGRMAAPPHGLPDDAAANAPAHSNRPAGWREWRFARHGRFIESRCEAFPVTSGAIKRVMERTPFLVNALFLTLRPDTVIPMHYDPINAYADLWLGVFVPDGAALGIRDEVRAPSEGGVMGFDHTFEHSAWNKGTSDRIVLSLLIHNPHLLPHEREIAAFMIPHLAKFGGRTIFA
ncbi:aspartyl/asparaginyl beta-hydroxylase domain-containing protein [Luteibacter sp. dw_328]|uniref:aspartyl/asparaginyl beta-hydroxylase domain-containing protein n=1 Tax=Luteibacter sp. dw_328 TaxID=2719796 RepID=UPI001BD21BA8|nr:aspartyl/asparaginyl beta-hydroxylase domain-containing protein [Luteibacter sp. dw_328]